MAPTDYEKNLIDEQINVYRRMIAMHRQKIIELTRQRNKQDYILEDFGLNIKNESGR